MSVQLMDVFIHFFHSVEQLDELLPIHTLKSEETEE